MRDDWSVSEKKVARQAFDEALKRELADVLQKFQAMAARAVEPADMWATEEFISEARREIERKYDFRYSQLISVFGALVREGRLSIDDLDGLNEYKLNGIRMLASM